MNELEDIITNADENVREDNEISAEPPQNEESESSADVSPSESIESLKAEIDRLRTELEESRSINQRISDDISEFQRLFPNAELSSLPDEVRDGVRSGIPLSASYALYEKRLAAECERIEAINRKNAQKSSGKAGKNTPKEYFSPDEVRAMSHSEVRENYTKIIASMKKWN